MSVFLDHRQDKQMLRFFEKHDDGTKLIADAISSLKRQIAEEEDRKGKLAPWRKVVETKFPPFGRRYEVLECGHKFDLETGSIHTSAGKPGAKRRRCHDCLRQGITAGSTGKI